MSTFSVGSTNWSTVLAYQGQSFKPNVAGPNGSGTPGSATQAALNSIVFGFDSADPLPSKCFIYSQPLDDPSQAGTDTTYLLGSSTSTQSGSEFGTGSTTCRFNFSGISLQVGSPYYAYFPEDHALRTQTPRCYSGGYLLDDVGSLINGTLQFMVHLTTI